MLTAIENRWRCFKGLLAFGWFLGFFYGASLRSYPVGIGMKMLVARAAFIVPVPLLLPDKHFLLNRRGAKMYKRLNSSPLDWDVAFGVYEYWKTRLFSDLVKEGMTILDIGGYEGYYSMLFARLMHDKGRVLAFEPDPDNCRWLGKNVGANNYRCVEVHQYALSDKEGDVTFYPAGGTGSVGRPSAEISLLHGRREPVTVRTRTLDNVLREANINNVDLIKMDVEGSDLLVLKGAYHTLKTMDVAILMDVDVHGDERRELFDLLKSCGFSLYRIGKEPKLITWPPQPAVLPTRGADRGGETPKPASGRPSSLRGRLTNLLPARIRAVLGVLLSTYLYIPLRWVKAPQDVREIYATKAEVSPGVADGN